MKSRNFIRSGENFIVRRIGNLIDVFRVGGNPREPMTSAYSRTCPTVREAKAFMANPAF